MPRAARVGGRAGALDSVVAMKCPFVVRGRGVRRTLARPNEQLPVRKILKVLFRVFSLGLGPQDFLDLVLLDALSVLVGAKSDSALTTGYVFGAPSNLGIYLAL